MASGAPIARPAARVRAALHNDQSAD
jgi:hypothetical protein